jgi:Ca2+-binding EF-hand superfamily protein
LGIALGVLGSRFIEAQERAVQQASELSRRRAMSLFSGSSSPTNALQQQQQQEEEEKQAQGLKHIVLELAAVAVILVIFAFVLKDDPGIDVNQADKWWKQWGNAMYYVLITATTVGYGDFHPASQTGRLLAIFFITISVGAMGHWLSLVAGLIMENKQSALRKQMQAKELTMEDLEVMDEDGDGQVTQIEFLEFMLVAMNKVDSETVKGLKEYFHRLDRDGNGTLSKDDLVDTVKGKLPTSARHKLELSSYKNELLSKATGSRISV